MSASAVRWAASGQLAIVVIQLLQTSVLARVLAPADFGLMALALVITGFLSAYMDLGISAGIVHKRTISHSQLSSLFTINLVAGLVALLAGVLLAKPLAHFFNEPSLSDFVVLGSLAVAASSAGLQFRALNQKFLRFSRMAIIDVSATLLGAAVAVTSALAGLGAISLVIGMVAASVAGCILNVASGLRDHRPGLSLRFEEARPFIRFGLFQMADTTINFFNSQLDVLTIGKSLGTSALGGYSLSRNVCQRPAGFVTVVVNRVTFPLMSMHQSDRDALRSMYLKAQRLTSTLTFPLFAFMASAAHPIVLVLLGPRWLAYVPVFRILAIYFLIRSTGTSVGSLLLSTGSVRRSLAWNLGILVLIPAFVLAGARWGILGVASAMVVLQLLLVVPAWRLLVNPCTGASLVEHFGALALPLLMAAIAGCIAYPAASISGQAPTNLACAAIVFGASYASMLALLDRSSLLAITGAMRWKA